MTRIGLLSDTHSYLDPNIFDFFKDCDEIWHGGDFGSPDIIADLEEWKPFKGVYGNIDTGILRQNYPLNLHWKTEDVSVFMTHIGGYPGRYNKRVKKILTETQPDLYICGHSHILKVMRDKELDLLHMNPGACGNEGFHRIRTMIRFAIDKAKILDVEVIELGTRGGYSNKRPKDL